MAATRQTVLTNSPRGDELRFDPATHNVILDMYVREVQRVRDDLTNVVIANLGQFAQPVMGCAMGA